MHIASSVKLPCCLFKLSSENENMGVCRADNSVQIWQNLPISNSIPDPFNGNIYIASLVKIPWYLLKLSAGNENIWAYLEADNSVKIWRNLPISNPKPDLLIVNAYSQFG